MKTRSNKRLVAVLLGAGVTFPLLGCGADAPEGSRPSEPSGAINSLPAELSGGHAYYFDPTSDLAIGNQWRPISCDANHNCVPSTPAFLLIRDYYAGLQGANNTFITTPAQFASARFGFRLAGGPSTPLLSPPPPLPYHGTTACMSGSFFPTYMQVCADVVVGSGFSNLEIKYFTSQFASIGTALLPSRTLNPNLFDVVCGPTIFTNAVTGAQWSRSDVGCVGEGTVPTVQIATTFGNLSVTAVRIVVGVQ